jgi:hypothetical protein
MIYVLCNVDTGELLQISEELIIASGHPLMVKTLNRGCPDFMRVEWSKTLLDFIDKPLKRLTKLQFVNLLGTSYRDILIAAKSNVDVEMFVRMLDWATPDADGTSIDLQDPRLSYALNQLELGGLLPVGKTQEILNG